MRILYLGPPSPLLDWLEERAEVFQTQQDVVAEACTFKFDLGVSFGYRYKVSEWLLARGPILNLHIGYLPFNKGADPNLWAWIEGTPHGVTLHWMDEGIDTGEIFRRSKLSISPTSTLRTSHAALQDAAFFLFKNNWLDIMEIVGTRHFVKDRPDLPQGWDTPVADLKKKICYTDE